jgi:hypothetical protein
MADGYRGAAWPLASHWTGHLWVDSLLLARGCAGLAPPKPTGSQPNSNDKGAYAPHAMTGRRGIAAADLGSHLSRDRPSDNGNCARR